MKTDLSTMGSMKSICTLLILSLMATGCSDDEPSASAALDAELGDLLQAVSPDGRESFILPEDGDFASLPQDPRNPITVEKVALGKMLFHETALGNEPLNPLGLKTYSCGSCHNASSAMQPGRRQGIAEGGLGFGISGEGRDMNPDYNEEDIDAQPIRAPSTLNVAYQKNLLWNGMFGATGLNLGTEANWTEDASVNLLGFEGAESQAIKGLEAHRMSASKDMMIELGYLDMLKEAFPGVEEDTLVSRVYMGLAIAAYVRTITSSQAPFQHWLRGDSDALTEQQKRGAVLFFGGANCVACHTGPGLNKMEFSAVGLSDLSGVGIANEDPEITSLGRGNFTGLEEDNYKFKIPQLYNLKDAPFLGHGSSITSLEEMVTYFNEAIPEKDLTVDQLDPLFVPLGLLDEEIEDLTAFLKEGLYDPDLARHIPEEILSNSCFPNADEVSKVDLGCN